MKLTENPEVEKFLKKKVRDVLNSIAGPFIGMFINEDDIYCKIITSLTEYFNNPENASDIEHMVDVITDSLTEKTVGEAIEIVMSQVRENTVGRFVEFVFGEISEFGNMADFIKEFMSEHSDSSIMEIMLKADRDFDKKLREYIVGISDMFSEKLLSMLSQERVVDILEKMFNVKLTDNAQKVAEGVLGFDYIWHENLNETVPGLTELVKKDLDLIQEKGMLEAVKTIL